MLNVGYCTNIHAGTSLDEVIANLKEFTLPVKQAVSPDGPMGIGLWLSSEAVEQALQKENWKRLKEFLDSNQLVAHTFNAFPQHNFHQPTVKHQVYLPDWTNLDRVNYTMRIAQLMSLLLPDDSFASISTVPLGWRTVAGRNNDHFRSAAARNLAAITGGLRTFPNETGVHIHLCLEPEPGCFLDRAEQFVDFYENDLLAEVENEDTVRSCVGVCHDICHSAVMFEPQLEALQDYVSAGILIGKVQISSALESRLGSNEKIIDELQGFIEPRYLHQTSLRGEDYSMQFFEDLPDALSEWKSSSKNGNSTTTARTHFHVPIHLETISALGTTQNEIDDCLKWFDKNQYRSHFEVETYAWSVSPESIRGGTMVDSLVAELSWLDSRFPFLSQLNCH